MIKTKDDLKKYLQSDCGGFFSGNRKAKEAYMKRVKDPRRLIAVYLRYLRKEEFCLNRDKKTILSKISCLLFERRRNRIGERIGFCMEANCFEEGLTIDHCGSIVVNPKAKIGKNCRLHGNNCIGNNGSVDLAPKIGNNVDIGFGAVLIGDIYIADGIKIGANAVVNKSFFEEGITIAGVPAKRVR